MTSMCGRDIARNLQTPGATATIIWAGRPRHLTTIREYQPLPGIVSLAQYNAEQQSRPAEQIVPCWLASTDHGWDLPLAPGVPVHVVQLDHPQPAFDQEHAA